VGRRDARHLRRLRLPANITHAIENVPIGGVRLSWWYPAPRLALQPVLVWWALFCAGVVDWRWRKANSSAD
jgi:uncharacterized membrane protein